MIERLAGMGLAPELHVATTDADIPELKRLQSAGKISAQQKDEIALFGPVRNLVDRQGFDAVALGLRKQESKGRKMDGVVHGPIYMRKDGMLRCNPISDWSWQDVFACIAEHHLPLHPIYSAPLLQMENRGRIRLSWWLSTDHWRHGEIKWVRTIYPQVYSEIARHVPEVSLYA